MQATISDAPISAAQRWTSRILIGLPALFLLLDGVMKLIKPAPVVDATVKLGYPESVILPLGLILSICTIIYLVPRTAVLGAILLTGYLGGAVATHVRAGDGAFPILFPALIGAMLWGACTCRMRGCGLCCRWPRRRSLRRKSNCGPGELSRRCLC